MRVRVSQATGGTKYFIITVVSYSNPDTTVTIYGGTDYDLTNETISSPYYSVVKAPLGFPLNPTKWTAETSDTSARTQASPVNGTWYNLGSITISIPIGCWRVYYEVTPSITNTAADVAIDAFSTLSTANSTESDTAMTAYALTGDASAAGKFVAHTVHRERILDLAAKTSYFLNAKVSSGGTTLAFEGSVSPTIIRAECAYL